MNNQDHSDNAVTQIADGGGNLEQIGRDKITQTTNFSLTVFRVCIQVIIYGGLAVTLWHFGPQIMERLPQDSEKQTHQRDWTQVL